MEDTVIKGHYFNRMDSGSQYGFKYVYHLKNEDFEKPIRLILTGKVRTNFVHSTGAITYVHADSIKVINWDGSNLTKHVSDLNKWGYFKEVVNFKRSDSWGRYTRIEFQGLLGDPRYEVFDLDSIRIKLIRFD